MQGKNLFRRGFKTEAEARAVAYRAKVSQGAWSPLDAFKLAAYLDVAVFPADSIITSSEDLALLAGENGLDNCGWSALTMINISGNRIIIHNQNHGPARQQSDMAR